MLAPVSACVTFVCRSVFTHRARGSRILLNNMRLCVRFFLLLLCTLSVWCKQPHNVHILIVAYTLVGRVAAHESGGRLQLLQVGALDAVLAGSEEHRATLELAMAKEKEKQSCYK